MFAVIIDLETVQHDYLIFFPPMENITYVNKLTAIFFIWQSFITQDASDRDLLVRQFKKYDIPVLNYMGDKGMRTEPFNITMEVSKHYPSI